MTEQNGELMNRKIKDAVETLCEDWAGRNWFSGVCMVKCKGHTVFSGAYGLQTGHLKYLIKLTRNLIRRLLRKCLRQWPFCNWYRRKTEIVRLHNAND